MEYEKIIKLISDFGNSKLNNLKIDFPDGTKIDMNKNDSELVYKKSPNTYQETKTEENAEMVVENKIDKVPNADGNIQKSPMVGTFYIKPSPNAKPYVEVGKKVKKGDILCIIEAMKLMNEIEAEYDGEIKEILVKDGDSIEYGKPLFKIG